MSAAFKVRGTIPAAFMLAVGAFKIAVNLAGGYWLEMCVSAGPEPPAPLSPWHPAHRRESKILFPSAVVAPPAALPVGVFDVPAVATGSALARAGADAPGEEGVAADVGVSPRPHTQETRPFMGSGTQSQRNHASSLHLGRGCRQNGGQLSVGTRRAASQSP
jgi:hypothetical protein